MLIKIDLREKYGNYVFLLIFPLKLLIFRLVITYFGTPQIAPDHTIFVKKFPVENAPRTPLATVSLLNVTGPPTHLLCYYLFKLLALFKGIFEECLSDIYLLDLTEVKQVYRH